MTLTEFRYIVTLAEEGHFGRAAIRCHVSQPTLSIAVKKLEDELGLVLFERSKLRVSPTASGEQIIARALIVLEQTAAIRDLAETEKEQLHSPLRLGVLPGIGTYLLPQLMPLLQELAPAMPLYVDEAQADALAKQLRNGDLDVLLVTQPFSENEVACQTLYPEPLVALLPPQHPLKNRELLEAADLDPSEVLLPGDSLGLRQHILQAFPHLEDYNHRGSGRSHFQSSSLEALRYMVASGLGVAIVPKMAADNALYARNNLVIKHFAAPVPQRELALAWRLTFPRHKAIDALRKALLACSGWHFSGQRQFEPPGLIVENSNW